ncbi:hypothetical protein IT575_08130 [bacterium]|nr:hypothetical protein [bacterium]
MLSSYLLGVLLAAKLLRYVALSQWQLAGRSTLALAGPLLLLAVLLPPGGSIFEPAYVPAAGGLQWGIFLTNMLSVFGAMFVLGLIGFFIFLPRGPVQIYFASAFGGSLFFSLFSIYVQLVCFYEPGWYWGWYRSW